jgi:hypothetical protein
MDLRVVVDFGELEEDRDDLENQRHLRQIKETVSDRAERRTSITNTTTSSRVPRPDATLLGYPSWPCRKRQRRRSERQRAPRR